MYVCMYVCIIHTPHTHAHSQPHPPLQYVHGFHGPVELGQLHQLLPLQVIVVARRLNARLNDGLDLVHAWGEGEVHMVN